MNTSETAANAATALAQFVGALKRDNIQLTEVVLSAPSYELFVHCMPATMWPTAAADGRFIFQVAADQILVRKADPPVEPPK